MSLAVIAGALLVVVPIAFNVAFFGLARRFAYPGILREPVAVILARFSAGGTGLVVLWWAFMIVALLFVPLSTAVGVVLVADGATEVTTWLAVLSVVVGVLAGLVQTLGLARWPFLVPELARRHAAAPESSVERATVELVFAAAHRYLGVGIGEALGYLLTGVWTVVVAVVIVAGGAVPAVLGVVGIPIGLAVAAGTLEFVGSHEPDGWHVVGEIVPIAYIAWSLWLVAVGVSLLLGLH